MKVSYRTAPFVADDAAPTALSVSADELGEPGAWGRQFVRGDPDHALASARVIVDAVYTSPREYHVAMEPHATVASWSPESMLTVWEPSQWVEGARATFAEWFELPLDKVRVISPFVGGGFGSKGGPQPHAALAAMAAREVGRPVKLALARPQTFPGTSPRPAIRQRLVLGADTDGRLQALVHEAVNETPIDDVYLEPVGGVSRYTYAAPNLRTSHRVVRVNAVTPAWMRAPGEAMGTFARWNRPWTSSPTPSRWTPWSCGCATTPNRTWKAASHGRRGPCARLTPRGQVRSAGSDEIRARAPCAAAGT